MKDFDYLLYYFLFINCIIYLFYFNICLNENKLVDDEYSKTILAVLQYTLTRIPVSLVMQCCNILMKLTHKEQFLVSLEFIFLAKCKTGCQYHWSKLTIASDIEFLQEEASWRIPVKHVLSGTLWIIARLHVVDMRCLAFAFI